MAGRRTNLALAALLTAALVTGGLSFAFGSTVARWPVVAHGVAGLAIVVLVPWKTVIARRGLANRRPGHGASIVLAVLMVVTVGSGILFSTGLVGRYGPLNAMQVHVGSALVAVPLFVLHLRIRPVRPRRLDLGRRNLLKAGALSAAGAGVWLGIETTARLAGLPGRRRRFTGSFERGSHVPAAMPATQWLDDTAPDIDPATWRLEVTAVGETRSLGLAAIDGTDDLTAILDCTSGWWSEQRWSGTRLDRLVGDTDGRSVVVRSATGYTRRFPREDMSRLLLATRIGDEPLTSRHGAPARLVAPGRRGFWWVKWVISIEVDDRPWWLQPPFPLT